MKKLFLTLMMFAIGAAAFAQSNAKERSDETSQPEIDNLSGLKPDEESLQESVAVGLSSGQTTNGGIEGTDDAYSTNGVKGAVSGNEKGTILSDAAVYPNPATDFITITSDVESGTITILNILGQPMGTYAVEGKTTLLDIGFLNEGIYFITIESGTEKITKKLKVLY